MAQMVAMLTNIINALPSSIAAAVTASSNHRMANAKLEVKAFERIKTFTNKPEAWKEWRNQFFYVIQECDHSFADFLCGLEKKTEEVDSLSDLTPTQVQLSAALFNRLHAVTSGTANVIVMSAKEGNGCEAWRLLNKTYDPRTDQRFTKVFMEMVNFKIKNKDIQTGILEWEQLVSSLSPRTTMSGCSPSS